MSRKENFHLQPFNSETSEEEWFRLSILDVVVPPNYNNYAIIFEDDQSDASTIVDTFKNGILATLRQSRHLTGTIQRNKYGDYSIVRKPESTVEFVVQWLNDSENDFPSYADLERANFTLAKLYSGHISLGIEGMPSSCAPDDAPAILAFQLNLIKGGFILTVHVHHFALDMSGTASLVQQIAQNCYSIRNGTPQPAWDESLMDRSRFIVPKVAEADQIDPPPRPPRHPDWLPCSWLLFHLPPAKCAAVRQLAHSSDSNRRISTYDALVALLWRVMARNRARIYPPSDLAAQAIFGEPINMRNRCTPPIPARYQGNVLVAGLSMTQEKPLTLADVISDASLPEMALFIRTVTNSVGQHTVDETLAKIAPIRDKRSLDMPLDSLPPLSFTTTDWRGAKLCDNDFGIGKAMAYRCLYDAVVENMIILYPPHRGTIEGEQGIEVLLPFETHRLDILTQDADMREYFELRGVELNDESRRNIG